MTAWPAADSGTVGPATTNSPTMAVIAASHSRGCTRRGRVDSEGMIAA